jgi:hypothetical protein
MKIKWLALLGLALCVTPPAFGQRLGIAEFRLTSGFGRFDLSGVHGQSVVVRCGLAVGGSGCWTNPHPTSITVRTGAGRYVTTIQTDSQGRFRKALRPGRYTLTPYVRVTTSPDGGVGVTLPYANPVQVVVPRGQFVPVTFRYSWGL